MCIAFVSFEKRKIIQNNPAFTPSEFIKSPAHTLTKQLIVHCLNWAYWVSHLVYLTTSAWSKNVSS